MASFRSFLTALVAAPLLLAGPAMAAAAPRSPSAARPASRPAPLAHRAPAARPQAAPVARPAQPVAAVALAVAEAPAAAPQEVSLSGIVVGTDGKPLPGACVYPTTNARLIAVTDAHGAFRLRVPAAASLRLQADYVGLGSSRIAIDGQHPQPVIIALGR